MFNRADLHKDGIGVMLNHRNMFFVRTVGSVGGEFFSLLSANNDSIVQFEKPHRSFPSFMTFNSG